MEIDRLHQPSRKTFEQEYLQKQRPVVITGVVDHWEAYTKWTEEYLKASYGDVEINATEIRQAGAINSKEKAIKESKMPFGRFIDLLDRAGKQEIDYYLGPVIIPKVFPNLMKDITLPDYFNHTKSAFVNFWYGSGRNVAPLHYDSYHNFLVMVRGQKRIHLYHPKEIENLYPLSIKYGDYFFSQVNIVKPDLEQFPNFKKTQGMEVLLNAGEMLFIPLYWWHSVFGIDRNISLNFWWNPPKGHLLKYPRQTGRSLARLAMIGWDTLAKKK